MTPYTLDSFLGTAGTDVTARVGEVNATWAQHPVAAAPIVLRGGAGTVGPAGTTGIAIALATYAPASPDQVVAGTIVLKSLRATDYACVCARYDPATDNGYVAGYGEGLGWFIGKRVASAFATIGTAYAGALADADTFAIRAVGTTLTLYVNNVPRVTVPDATFAGAGRCGVFAYASVAPSASVGVHIRGMVSYPAAMESGDRFVCCDGDSLTSGYGATLGTGTVAGHAYPGRLRALLGEGSGVVNLGRNGYRIDQMAADASTRVDATYDAGRTLDALVMFGGANDAAQGASAATLIARASAYWTSRRAATPGRRLIACTLPPIASTATATLSVTPAAYNAVAATWSAWLRANYAAIGCDAIADLAGHPALTAPDVAGLTVDGLHYTDRGYAAVAATVYQAASGLASAAPTAGSRANTSIGF